MNKNELISLQDKLMAQNNELVEELFQYLDLLIIEDIEKSILSSGASYQTVAKIYKADHWTEIQSKIDKLKESNLKSIFANYRKGIDSLVEFYGVEFSILNVQDQWDDLEKMVNDATTISDLMLGTKQETKLLMRSSQALTVTENARRVVEYVSKATKKTIAQSQTLVETMQNNVFNNQRQKFYKKVPATGEKLYEYVGPVDKLTRPICKRYVGKQYTEAKWKRISNEQVGNMWNYKGGYNCRHFFLLVPEQL